MNNTSFFVYLIVMAGSTYLIRMLPFLLVKKKVRHSFVRSFLFYIPYAVLGAMTFPAVFMATGSSISALVGVVVAVTVAIKKDNLLLVAAVACVAVYITNIIVL